MNCLLEARILPDYFRYLNKNNPVRTWRLDQISGEYYAGVWTTDSRTDYVYSFAYPTRLDTLKAYALSGDEYFLMRKMVYEYDQTGQNCIQVTTFDTDGCTFSPSYRTTYQYDTQNRVSMIVWDAYDIETSEWDFTCWGKIYYNASSLNYLVDYYAAYEEDSPYWDKTTYVNDGQGRPIFQRPRPPLIR